MNSEERFFKHTGIRFDDFYSTSLVKMKYILFKNSAETEETINDMCSVVYMRILDYIESYDTTKSLNNWWITIAVNHAREHFRKNSRLKIDRTAEISNMLFDDSDYAYNENIDIMFERVMKIIQNDIKLKYKELIELKYIEKLSLQEIADRKNMNLSTLKTSLTFAKNSIKKIYKEKYEIL